VGRLGLILASVVVLSGCALPLPVRVATWAIDGISYLATNKSITEHGVSFLAKKDCSILRGVTQKHFCIDGAPSDTAVAALEGGDSAETGTLGDDAEFAVNSLADFDTLDNFETAAGPAPIPPISQESTPTAAPFADLRVVKDNPAIAKLFAAVPSRRPQRQPRAASTSAAGPGFYYVVGSFRYMDNAQSLADDHSSLAPTIVEALLDGATHFRVIVGPFERSRGKYLRWRLHRAGISDAWAIALNPVEWSVAQSRASSFPEVASAVAAQ
jgi:hypothetical protein